MGRGLAGWTLGGVVAALVSIPALPAAAAVDEVSLDSAAPNPVRYGGTVTVSGTVSPASGGQIVQIVEAADPGVVLGQDTTGAAGGYAVEITPEANVVVRARWVEADAFSPPEQDLTVRVRPRLTARLAGARLFARARVTGRLAPSHPGETVRVLLHRGGEVVGRRQVRLVGGETFRAAFQILRTGRYRAEVRFNDADHVPVAKRTRASRVALPPPIGPGSKGTNVLLLERRLRQLHYYLRGANRRYDHRTGDAVLAFHKVQGMDRVKNVRKATWRRLQSPRRPGPRARKPAFHVEIDQTRQVLYVIRSGKIDEIIHTSTGAGGATRDGIFRVHRKIAGYSPGRLYYPSYFDGNRAVHGWPSVPTYPASHGCARVPYWTAIHLHNIMPYGTVVRVYHS
jgi:lipoprotein-anchoring transpeptidase ErfK/SrfK